MTDVPEHLMVDIAVRALNAFGTDLSREEAARLLPLWRYRQQLSDDAVRAVLDQFPPAGGPGGERP